MQDSKPWWFKILGILEICKILNDFPEIPVKIQKFRGNSWNSSQAHLAFTKRFPVSSVGVVWIFSAIAHYRFCLIFLHHKIDALFSAFFEDIEIRVSDSRPDISTNRKQKWNIHMSKSKFGCWQPETNQLLKIENVAIV